MNWVHVFDESRSYKRVSFFWALDTLEKIENLNLIKPAGTVLDYGCGLFSLGNLLNERGFTCEGFEVNTTVRITAGQKIFFDRDHIPKKKYDVILLNSVIQYLNEEELSPFLKGAKAWLKEGGQILIIDIASEPSGILKDLKDVLTNSLKKGFFFDQLLFVIQIYLKSRNLHRELWSTERLKSACDKEYWRIQYLSKNLSIFSTRKSCVLSSIENEQSL